MEPGECVAYFCLSCNYCIYDSLSLSCSLSFLCLAPSLRPSLYTTLLRADIPELNLALPACCLSALKLSVVEPEKPLTEKLQSVHISLIFSIFLLLGVYIQVKVKLFRLKYRRKLQHAMFQALLSQGPIQ